MEEQICNLYKKGCTILNISKQLNVPKRKVRKILVSNNIELKKPGFCNRKYIVYEDFFDNIDTEEKAYFLGFLYADGYNNTQNSFIRLTLHEKDVHILEILNKLIQRDRPIATYTHKERKTNYNTLTIRSKKISKRLEEIGCFQKKTFLIEFPSEDIVSCSLQRHFIRGYFDGDGCITGNISRGKKTPSFQFSLVSTEIFLNSIINIFNKEMGIQINKMYTRHPERNNCIRTIFVGGNNNCKLIRDWLYQDSTIYLDRKKEIFDLI